MNAIDPERWRTLDPYLDRALDLPETERGEWLARIACEDPVLAQDLRSLLAQDAAAEREGYLEEGVALAAGALDERSPLAGQTLGAYTLEAPLGRGGMGSVWLARRSDGRFEGRVAVKLLDAALIGRTGEERFRREGSTLGRLTHPHIAHLIDAGVSPAGQPYLVLEYVEGAHIDEYCDTQSLDVEARIRLFLDVLSAVAHAHANLVVHRDLKPSNVLVTMQGDVKLLDFGIAKLLEAQALGGGATELTREGGRALTPEYAAPEQMLGGAVTTATDVYALGVLLYVLLAGQHPAGASTDSPARLVNAIVDAEAPRLSEAVTSPKTLPVATLIANAARRASTPDRLGRALRGDLDNIVAKALKKDPLERYVSATALAEDLRRYLNHEPVTARPDSLGYRAAKFVRRNRAPVLLAALAIAAMLAGLAGTITQAQRAKRQAAAAELERKRADDEAQAAHEQRNFALRQLSRAEAINDLNRFVLYDAAPSGKPLSVGELLQRAEGIIERAHAESDANRVEMLVAIGYQYWSREESDKARELLERAYALSRHIDDPSARARAACTLAPVVANAGDTERGERLFQEALTELPDGAEYVADRINCLGNGTDVAHFGLSDSKAAVERAEEARALLSRLPYPSPVLELQVWMELVTAYRADGRLRDAIAAAQGAYERLQALGRENTEDASVLLSDWGMSLTSLGQPLEAEKLFRRAIGIVSPDAIVTSTSDVEPLMLTDLAGALSALERLPEAARYAESAHRRAVELGDTGDIRAALYVLTRIYAKTGEPGRAAAALAELEQIDEASASRSPVTDAQRAYLRAWVARARGDLDAAVTHANDAVSLIDATNGERRYRMIFRSQLADLDVEAHRYSEAQADAKDLLALWQEIADPDEPSAYVGGAYLALGQALLAQGQPAQARLALESALRNFTAAVGEDHPKTRLTAQLLAGLTANTLSSP